VVNGEQRGVESLIVVIALRDSSQRARRPTRGGGDSSALAGVRNDITRGIVVSGKVLQWGRSIQT
jgi:hypothetical protein